MSDRQPDFIDKAWSAFRAALTAPVEERWPATIAALGGFAVLALLMATSPTLYLNDMALDAFIPLDGALRMSAGQWPHADFYTPIGALYYLLLGAAGKLTGDAAVTVIWAQLLIAPVVVILVWIATRDRLPIPHRLGLILFAAVATISPRTLDSDGLISHLAAYNRLGWVLTTIVFMAVAIEPLRTDRRREALEATALIACTVMVFYLKVTFFVLCGAALIVGVLSRPSNWRSPLAAGIGSLVVIGLGFLLLETNSLYIADLQRAAGSSPDAGLIRTDRFQAIFIGNRAGIIAPVLFFLWLIRTSPTEAGQAEASKITVKLGALIAASLLITSQSHDAAMPVLAVIAVACFAALRARDLEVVNHGPLSVVGLVTMAMVAWPIWLDAQAILRHAAMSRSAATVPLSAMQGSPITDIRVPAPSPAPAAVDRVIAGTLPPDAYDNLMGVQWNKDDDIILRDARALLVKHGKTDVRIASLTFSPSFPWIMGAPPPKHLPAWYDFRRTFTAEAAGDLALTFSDTDVVLVPEVWRIEGIWDVYGAYIEAHFTKLEETPLWSLWSR